MGDLTGKVAAITGAGSGIGQAIALSMAAAGASVALSDLDLEALTTTTALLAKAGVAPERSTTMRCDVAHGAEMAAFAAEAFDHFGHVDIVVNNAGVMVGGYLWERPAQDLAFVLGVNLWGILNGIWAFVPRLLDQGTPANVVNICSIAGLLGSPLTGPYSISKFAALAATESLAHDLALVGAPITVTAVCPGMVDTNLAHGSVRARPEELLAPTTDDGELATTILEQYLAEGISPAEVADMVLEAIEQGTFCVLTHPHHREDLVTRARQLAAGQLPTAGEFR